MEVKVLYLSTNIYVVAKTKQQGPLIFLQNPYELRYTVNQDKTLTTTFVPFLPFSVQDTSHGFAIHSDHILYYGRTTTDIANQYNQLTK